jgi:hypothetical protein
MARWAQPVRDAAGDTDPPLGVAAESQSATEGARWTTGAAARRVLSRWMTASGFVRCL